jgi:hypothetical protein
VTVYLAIASKKPKEFEEILKSKIPSHDVYKMDTQTWLISPPSNIVTPKELCTFLGISTGAAGHIFMTIVGAYYGYHSKDVWDWLSSKGA